MLINVTQECIDRGEHNCTKCPVALAIKAAYPEAEMVSVGFEFAKIFFPGLNNVIYSLPREVSQWIRDYEYLYCEEPRKPISFVLVPYTS